MLSKERKRASSFITDHEKEAVTVNLHREDRRALKRQVSFTCPDIDRGPCPYRHVIYGSNKGVKRNWFLCSRIRDFEDIILVH